VPAPKDPERDEPADAELRALRDHGSNVDVSDAVMRRIARLKRLAPWLLGGALLGVLIWALFLSELFSWGANELGAP